MKIGIIGGGQLGMMMVEAATDHEVYSLDPSSRCACAKLSAKHFECEFSDINCIKTLCEEVDVVTYEFENIDLNVIEELEQEYLIYPSSKALKYSQNRLVEKDFIKSLGISTAKYYEINSVSDFQDVDLTKKYILKTTSGGYDGKGQILINNKVDDVALKLVKDRQCILEEFVDFDYEVSIIVTRNNDETVYFPLVQNIHKKGILYKTIASKSVDKVIESKARDAAFKISSELELIGTLAIEFFVKDEEVIFNEMAPRPHNSGHYTIEGCNVSQFANHIRAITAQKLIEPVLLADSVMFNILGDKINNDFSKYNGYFHNYFKGEAKAGRKMGHITFTGEDLEQKVEYYMEDEDDCKTSLC